MEIDESLKKEKMNSKDHENPKKGKSFGVKLKELLKTGGLAMAALLLLMIGGPIGIILGIALSLLAAKKAFDIGKNMVGKEKAKITELKARKARKTHSLEMDVTSFKNMKTRSNSISKIDVIPKESAKSTSNGLQTNNSRFQDLIKPSIELSKVAMKKRNFPASSPAKRKSLSNIKSVKPSL
jgi:hypothetical protein